jgi:hypothetical protein
MVAVEEAAVECAASSEVARLEEEDAAWTESVAAAVTTA